MNVARSRMPAGIFLLAGGSNSVVLEYEYAAGADYPTRVPPDRQIEGRLLSHDGA